MKLIRMMMFAGGFVCGTLLAVGASAGANEGTELPGPLPTEAEIKSMIVEEAKALEIDPALALAMAHVESHFDPSALSHKGARGIMQIMPATVEGEYGLHRDILWEPRLNIRIGLHFIGRLLKQYRQQEQFALSYYNGGSRVGRWPNVKIIPATRGYVQKVLAKKEMYQNQLNQLADRNNESLTAAVPG